MTTIRGLGIVPILDIIGDENFDKYNVVCNNVLIASFETETEMNAFKKTLPATNKEKLSCLDWPKYSFWAPMINNNT